MGRTYSLYFDVSAPDWERRRRRVVLTVVIALHVLLLAWVLRAPPGTLRSATSMVVVLLRDGWSTSNSSAVADHKTAARATSGSASNATAGKPMQATRADAVRAADAARPLVAEGSIAYAQGRDRASSDAYASAGAGSNGSAPAGASDAGGAARHAPIFIPPRVLHHWKPPYPPEAYQAMLQGEAKILVSIDAAGTLTDARLDSSSGDASLDQASLDAVRHYVYAPATQGGTPIEAQAMVVVEWAIRPAAEIRVASGMTRSK